jgi:predicted dehydrogenase
VSSDHDLRAIVVGTSFGARVHVPALRAAGFEVAALVGRDAQRTADRAAQLGVPIASTRLRDALDRVDGPRCVTVATPPDAHTEPVLEALAAGAHVLCEKPFALGTADAREMTAAADAAGVVAVLGCEFRWATDEALTGRVVRSGSIGSPRVATFVQHSALLAHGLHGAFNEDWWFDPARGGGILNASGSHYVDRFRSWLGEVTGVSASLQVAGNRPPTAAEDTYTVLLRFASGCTGLIQQCSAARGTPGRMCRVVGDHGSVWIDDGVVWLADDGPARVVDVPADLRLPDPPPPSDDPKHAFTRIELPPYTRLAERFRDLVLGRPVDPDAPATPTFHEALRTQAVLDAMRTSSAAGGAWVDVATVR